MKVERPADLMHRKRAVSRFAAILAALFLAFSPCAPVAGGPNETAEEYFFREDHLTGGDYLHLDARGRYELKAREHMGIFVVDEGAWSKEGTTFTFRPLTPKSAVTGES